MVLAIFPVLIFLVFFFIYRAGNPIFDELASKINFDFISIYWCIFSVGGFLLMYAFFKHRVINSLIARDELTPDNLFPLTKENFANSATGKLITIPGLVYTGVLLLILLNVLLAAVNSVDIYYLGIAHRIPAGITFSQYLHNGTNSLIASIILAIAIILFYFRGYLNFYENNRLLKSLSFVWIIQNIILVISTAYRNTAYISNYGLTHKRIGVYVYLILCVVGLITTFIKISHKKNNWFLFRKNAWIFYGFMIIACPFDWDSIITTFDINRFQKDNTMEIDQRYLAQLSHTNLAQIFEYYIVEGKTLHANSNERQISRVETYNYYGEQIKNMIWYQYLDLKHDYAAHKWQSHCVTKSQNLKGVEKMIEEHHLVCPVSVR